MEITDAKFKPGDLVAVESDIKMVLLHENRPFRQITHPITSVHFDGKKFSYTVDQKGHVEEYSLVPEGALKAVAIDILTQKIKWVMSQEVV